MQKKLVGLAAMIAAMAFAAPAQANLTAGPVDATGYPTVLTDGFAQGASLCLDPAPACGAGAATASDMLTDGEAFYWGGAVDVDVPGGTVNIFFNVEAATAPGTFGGPASQITFQRIQIGGDLTLPNGVYTFVTPFGPITAEKTGTSARNRWSRLETADAQIGPIDRYLTSSSAPVGFYGNADAGPDTTLTSDFVSVYMPGQDPALDLPAGTSDKWVIMGATAGAPVVIPPQQPPVVTPPVKPVVQVVQQPPVVQTQTIERVIDRSSVSAPVQVAGPVAQAGFSGRVTGLSIRNGVLRGNSPRGADVVRLTVRKGSKLVKRITIHVNDNGQRLTRTLTRKAGRYSVTVQAGNEQHDVISFGPSVRRNFSVR